MGTAIRAGTIAVTPGSAIVTGTGTGWVAAGARAGWMLQLLAAGGDLTDYEILSVDSATQITLDRPYAGTTGAGRTYQIKPGAGLTAALRASVEALITATQTFVSGIGAGLFPDGTLAAPALRFAADQDTGIRRPGADVLALVTGGVERLRATAAGVQVTGLLSGTAVTQTQADTTAGRLLKVGDFGLGAVAPLIGDCGVIDNTIAPGFYCYSTGAGSSSGPAGASIGYLIHQRRGGDREAQIFTSEAGSTGQGMVYSRSRSVGVWGPWRAVGLRDAGSNANGVYTAYADGTLVCWHQLTLSASADVTWTYPMGFVGTPRCTALPVSSALTAFSPAIAARTATSAAFKAVAGGARAAIDVEVTAIGRWA